ncbi:MAG: T9SS type A sorting domain-containing protein, partial [Bacteroidota bacterium]
FFHPNPAQNLAYLHLKTSESTSLKLSIYDNLGRQVLFDDYGLIYEDTVVPILLSGLEAGIYYARIQCGETVIPRKIMVQK